MLVASTIMFLVVILSGAVKAIRHPERYGPRAMNGHGRPAQTRARGLTRAILETFPVAKFGRNTDPADESAAAPKPEEHALEDVELARNADRALNEMAQAAPAPIVATATTPALAVPQTPTAESGNEDGTRRALLDRGLPAGPTSSVPPSPAVVMAPPTAIPPVATSVDNTQTCPICVCDFEEGDDIRILPCDARHGLSSPFFHCAAVHC